MRLSLATHRRIQIDADHPARRPHLPRGDDAVESGPAPQVQHHFPGLEAAAEVRVADAGERRHGAGRRAIEPLGLIAEQLSRLTPVVEVELRLGAHFGVQLLERHGRSVRPTPAARLIEPYARQAVGLLRGAERAAADLQGLRTGALTVGASTTPGTYLLPAALGRFHAAHPALALRLRISDSREIERAVAAGQLDRGVIGEAPLRAGGAPQPLGMSALALPTP